MSELKQVPYSMQTAYESYPGSGEWYDIATGQRLWSMGKDKDGNPKAGIYTGPHTIRPNGQSDPLKLSTPEETTEETQTTETPVPDSEAGDGDTRTNANGITQKGMTLGGIKNFLDLNSTLDLKNGADFFDFSGTSQAKREKPYKDGGLTISTEESTYEVPDSAKPTTPAGTISGTDLKIPTGEAGGYTIPPASVPGTVGHTPEDPQAGISAAPDGADQTRALSFNQPKRGERAGNFRSRQADRGFGGQEPSNESLVSPMYKDKARNAYRGGFLDSTARGPMGVLRDASAAQGVIRTNDGKIAIKDGDNYRTYTGDKSAREVAYDLGGGQGGYNTHAADFETLTPPDTPEIQADDEQTPATIEPAWKDMTDEQKQGAVTAYAQDFVNTFKDKLKDK